MLRYCKFCGKEVYFWSSTYYFCRLCESYFHEGCLTIRNPKIHEHSLTYIRRKISARCDACGFVVTPDVFDMFACLNCDFFVHRSCILLPKVIKLTHHHSHYLSHVFHILGEETKCGVCKERFSSGYGGYFCIDKTCNYVVHSTCATNSNVWDGIDHVDTELEEWTTSSEYVSLKEMGDKWKVFIHGHGLSRFSFSDEEWCGQLCEACILPIDMGNLLGCKECSFALHEECGFLPIDALMYHPLHGGITLKHPLTLKFPRDIDEGFFTCSVCEQYSCGFMYHCLLPKCGFKMDAKCGSFTKSFKHKTHRCPLYLRQDERGGGNRIKSYLCSGCHEHSTTVATCTTCEDSSLDFKCLNLPPVLRYKDDIHPLYLYSDREHYNKQPLEKRQWAPPPSSWCEVCEEEIHENLFFYICFDCRITLHVKCILGNYPYMKPGRNIKVKGLEIQIASNSGASRPMCHTCHSLCGDKLVFKGKDLCFCSVECISSE